MKEKFRECEEKLFTLTEENTQKQSEIDELRDEIKELTQENEQMKEKNDE